MKTRASQIKDSLDGDQPAMTVAKAFEKSAEIGFRCIRRKIEEEQTLFVARDGSGLCRCVVRHLPPFDPRPLSPDAGPPQSMVVSLEPWASSNARVSSTFRRETIPRVCNVGYCFRVMFREGPRATLESEIADTRGGRSESFLCLDKGWPEGKTISALARPH